LAWEGVGTVAETLGQGRGWEPKTNKAGISCSVVSGQDSFVKNEDLPRPIIPTVR